MKIDWAKLDDPNVDQVKAQNLGSVLFGWVDWDERTSQERSVHEEIVKGFPRFAIQGSDPKAGLDTKKALLWEIQKETYGEPFRVFHQFKGSCVGQGAGQAANTLMVVESLLKKEPEEVKFPLFWLHAYGWSRKLAGWDSTGEGSFGSTMAKALIEHGMFNNEEFPSLPKAVISAEGGLNWGAENELKYSAVKNHPAEWEGAGKKHLIGNAAQIKSADEAHVALANGYPMTIASNWGGHMQCPVVEGVLLNSKRIFPWPHQMSVHGVWIHDKLGRIFYVLNSWGQKAHGVCPTGAPVGGFWLQEKDIDWICRNGECYALSAYQGYPKRVDKLNWGELTW